MNGKRTGDGTGKTEGAALPLREHVAAIRALLDAGWTVNLSRYAAEHVVDRSTLSWALNREGVSVRRENNRLRDRRAAEVEAHAEAKGVSFLRACSELGLAEEYFTLMSHRSEQAKAREFARIRGIGREVAKALLSGAEEGTDVD